MLTTGSGLTSEAGEGRIGQEVIVETIECADFYSLTVEMGYVCPFERAARWWLNEKTTCNMTPLEAGQTLRKWVDWTPNEADFGEV